jgi:hypothetical protein
LGAHGGVDKHSRALGYDVVGSVYRVIDISEEIYGSIFGLVQGEVLNAQHRSFWPIDNNYSY